MDERTYFLTVSNGRSGSTWLETSLGRLPDTVVDYEFKWRPRGYRPSPVHLVLPDQVATCRAGLDSISADAPIAGSKLVLDPYTVFPGDELSALLAAIEPEVRIVHLTRSYFDILLSFGARGGRNLLNDVDEADDLKRKFGADSAILGEMIKQTENDIAAGGRESPRVLSYDINTILNKYLILLVNDLICAEIGRRAEAAMRVDYTEVEARFPEVATFVGSRCPAGQAAEIIRRPVTRKLRKLPGGLITEHEKAKALSAYFESVRDELIETAAPIDSVWQGTDVTLPRSRELARILQ